jgi:hypothetical protein
MSNGSPVRFASSLAAAALDGLFEHPAAYSVFVSAFTLVRISPSKERLNNYFFGDLAVIGEH